MKRFPTARELQAFSIFMGPRVLCGETYGMRVLWIEEGFSFWWSNRPKLPPHCQTDRESRRLVRDREEKSPRDFERADSKGFAMGRLGTMRRATLPGLGIARKCATQVILRQGFRAIWQFRESVGNGPKIALPAGSYPRDNRLTRVEAVLFLSREPISSRKIAQLANLADGTEARTLVRQLNKLYDAGSSAFRAEEVAGGFQLLTRPMFGGWLRRLAQRPATARLSGPAMETLAVVAYRQPILRAEIEAVRGVQCGDILRQLLERDLVKISGRAEDLGRPLLYGTTRPFLELFGLRHIDDLPRAEEFRAAAAESFSTVAPTASDGALGTIDNGNPGAGRAIDNYPQSNPEEESVTTRIRPAASREDLIDDPLALAQAARFGVTYAPIVAEDEAEEEEEDDDWDDDEDDDEEEDEDEDEDEEDDDFVDEEWEEVDDEDEEDDEEDDDDDDWDDDDDDWDDDEEEEEEEDEV